MNDKNILRFDQAINCITPRIKGILQKIADELKPNIQEIRLRSNMPVILVCGQGSAFVTPNSRLTYLYTEGALTASVTEVVDTFNRLCGYSLHSHQSSIINGYITIEGGHRAGICGTSACEDGRIVGVRDISSINIRVAREFHGAADMLMQKIFKNGLRSVIIAGPPSSGKTTLLRDIARQLSSGCGDKYYKVVLADERQELAAVTQGIPENNVGINCDVLNGYPKSEAIMIALRSLSPEVIICDEVGSLEEISAIEAGMNSGVKFIVSVHASTHAEIVKRIQIQRLLMSFAFDYLVLLKNGNPPCQISKIYKTGDLTDEIGSSLLDRNSLHSSGSILQHRGVTPYTGA